MQCSSPCKTHVSHKCRVHLIITKNLSSPFLPLSLPFSPLFCSHLTTFPTEIPLVPKYQNQLQPLLFCSTPVTSHIHSWNNILKRSLVAAGQRHSMKRNIKWDPWVLWKFQMPAALNQLCISAKHRAPPNAQTVKGKEKENQSFIYCPAFPSEKNKTSLFPDANLVQENLALLVPSPLPPTTFPTIARDSVLDSHLSSATCRGTCVPH